MTIAGLFAFSEANNFTFPTGRTAWFWLRGMGRAECSAVPSWRLAAAWEIILEPWKLQL